MRSGLRPRGPWNLTNLFRAGGWVGTVAIVVLSVLPGDDRPHSGAPGVLEHIVAYLLVAALFTLGYRGAKRIVLCSLLFILAALLEVVQIWIPGRTAEFIGFAASTSGLFAGFLLVGLARFIWFAPCRS